jgi:predicted protein tyrosine phosphatase
MEELYSNQRKSHLLFLCSLNQNRSPTAEALFYGSTDYEAKSAGLFPGANMKLFPETIGWADTIIVMDEIWDRHKSILLEIFPNAKSKDIRVLNIRDKYDAEDPELERLLLERLATEGIFP